METKKENFIMIPYSVLGNTEISPRAKLLFGFINSFNQKGNECFVCNETFAELMGGCSTRIISSCVAELKKQGLVLSKNKKGDRILVISNPNLPEPQVKNSFKEISLENVVEQYLDSINKFIAHRKSIGKPFRSQEQFDTFYKKFVRDVYTSKLDEDTLTQTQVSVEMIERAIAGGYSNVIPLYKKKSSPSNYATPKAKSKGQVNLSDSIRNLLRDSSNK